MDIWEYFTQREQQVRELSLYPTGDFWGGCAAEAGSNDLRGRIFDAYHLMGGVFLHVHEVVVVEGNHVHREEYGYFLVIDGEEIWGEERDPTHDPAVHRHSTGHVREDSEPISFKEAAERAWDEVSRRMESGEEPGQ
ncbi:MAG TPA: hypothetical protein VFV91_10705 [Gaiellaceae bacterium]|nr:hypothetical protein [Gaiellaceae bacterium]